MKISTAMIFGSVFAMLISANAALADPFTVDQANTTARQGARSIQFFWSSTLMSVAR